MPRIKPRVELQLNNALDWEAAVFSSDPAVQLRTVAWALEVADNQGLLFTSLDQGDETQ